MRPILLVLILTSACGGEAFRMADQLDPPDAGRPLGQVEPPPDANDTGTTTADVVAPPQEAGMAPVDAGVEAAPDAGPDAGEAGPGPVKASLCCNRPNGAALCVDTPWWCCASDSCSSIANCGASYSSDGGNVCASMVGSRCGLIGGPASGTVGPCL